MSIPSNEVWVNDPIIPAPLGIYDTTVMTGTATQPAPFGTRLRMSDRTYYLAYSTASNTGGTVLCALEPTASHQSGILAVAATSAGSKVISCTSSAAVTANYYAEGFFGVATGTNAGEMYRIKGNVAGSTGFLVTLYDGLNTALTSGTAFWLAPNMFSNVSVGSAGLDTPLGVLPVTMTTGGTWFWLQTWGQANPLHQAATPAGAALALGTTGGVVAAFNAGTTGPNAYATIIGKNSYLAATAGQSNPVLLTILP